MRDQLISMWKDEYRRTQRVLDAFEPEAAAFTPHPRSATTLQIVWTLVTALDVLTDRVLGTASTLAPAPRTAPATLPEARRELDLAFDGLVAKLESVADGHLGTTISVPVSSEQTADVPRGAMVSVLMHDHIHHRGQLSVYIRLTGGLVPSIYGPSADAPPAP